MLVGIIVDFDIFILCLFEDDWCDSRHYIWCVVKKKHNVGSRTCFGGKKHGTQNEIEKRRKINQDSCSDWQRAKVFSVKVLRTALILFLLPSPSLIHHLPPRPSWCCRLLLNVSPNSPSSSLALHSIVPPPPPPHFLPQSFSSPWTAVWSPSEAAERHSFNLPLL